ncbi:MAG: AAA family ATPase [Candidatus Dormibacter sp.]
MQPDLTIRIPAGALVLLIGAAGSGKSTFTARHFPADNIISPDRLRGLLSGDESSQARNDDVFARLHQLVEERTAAGLLTVVDATNTRGPARAELGWHAHQHHRPLVAIALVLPPETCFAQNAQRPRPIPPRVVRQQMADLRHVDSDLETEGYAAIYLIRSASDLDRVRITLPA